jgi:CRISPR-associated protein Cas5d
MKAERVSYDVMTPSAARGVLEAIYWKPQIRWIIDRIHVLRPIRLTSLRRNEVGSKIPAGTVESAMKAGSGSLGLIVEEDRQQRAATLLRNVEYVIEAHFEILDPSDSDGRPLSDKQAAAKHLDQFNRRARAGQCFHRPYLGCREFACDFELLEGDAPIAPRYVPPRDGSAPPDPFYGADAATRDLGFILHDIDFAEDPEGEIIEGSKGRRVRATARFFRARMESGVVVGQKRDGTILDRIPHPDDPELTS